MPGTIIVAGIPGVGKTTVLQELEKLSQEKKVTLEIVNFGSVMNQLSSRRDENSIVTICAVRTSACNRRSN